MLFSTDPDPSKSKTVCIAFNCPNKKSIANITLGEDSLPWKEFSKHIGNYLHENKDVKIKRAEFIQIRMSQNIEFECLAIESQIKLLNIYNSHFMDQMYGSLNLKLYNH